MAGIDKTEGSVGTDLSVDHGDKFGETEDLPVNPGAYVTANSEYSSMSANTGPLEINIIGNSPCENGLGVIQEPTYLPGGHSTGWNYPDP